MEEVEDDYATGRNAYEYVKDIVLAPFRIATSPALLRTYLRTALLFLTSSILFGTAVIAYTTFYYNYIPVRGISVPIYLQYDHTSPLCVSEITAKSERRTAYPYGIANVLGLVSRQKYDVIAEIDLPRNERNLDAGNWMVGVEMRAPGTVGGGLKGALGWEEEWEIEDFSQEGVPGKPPTETEKATAVQKPIVLARSRRPAILTYRSWMTELAYRFLRLPLYVLGFGQESEKIQLRMMESVEFEKGWRNIPSSVRLELRSRTPLAIYKVAVRFVAKLEGLRWIMYTYRLSSAVVFTSVFWGVEMSVVLLSWALLSICFGENAEDEAEKRKIKAEPGTATGSATPRTEPADSEPQTPMSDTSRTFPTLTHQHPLRYSTTEERAKAKEERDTPRLEDIPVKGVEEADDEDEDDESADFVLEESLPHGGTDSGIGTSLASSAERGPGLSRRRSGGGLKKER